METKILPQSGCFIVKVGDHEIEVCGQGFQADKAMAEFIAKACASHDALVAAAKETFLQLGTDPTWNISTLRLDVIRPALALAGVTV